MSLFCWFLSKDDNETCFAWISFCSPSFSFIRFRSTAVWRRNSTWFRYECVLHSLSHCLIESNNSCMFRVPPLLCLPKSLEVYPVGVIQETCSVLLWDNIWSRDSMTRWYRKTGLQKEGVCSKKDEQGKQTCNPIYEVFCVYLQLLKKRSSMRGEQMGPISSLLKEGNKFPVLNQEIERL